MAESLTNGVLWILIGIIITYIVEELILKKKLTIFSKKLKYRILNENFRIKFA